MLREKELIERLLNDVVTAEIDIDEAEMERAVYSIPSSFQREMFKTTLIILKLLWSP
jgi:hypothetical protein